MKPDYNALSKRLTTIQFPNTKAAASRLVDNELIIEEYRQRTYATRGKITKVLRPFEIGQAYNDDVRNLLGWLQDAIGVYNIPDFLNGRSHSWNKLSSVNPDEHLRGTGWHQYLGDPSIQNGGGRVVVVLSDEGVKWLNEIADKVKSYIPVDIPTTKSTDETDWSIGTKLIQQFWDPTEKPDIVRSLWED
jgi:hypothetical protein